MEEFVPRVTTVTSSHGWFRDYIPLNGDPGARILDNTSDSYPKIQITTDEHDVIQKRIWIFKDGNKDLSLLEELEWLFKMLGTEPEDLIVKGKLDIPRVFKAIYQIPLPENLVSLWCGTCGCNMGHCGAVIRLEPEVLESHDYRGLFKSLGIKPSEKAMKQGQYHEYPDSVQLTLRLVSKQSELPEVVGNCYDPKPVQVNLPFDGDRVYLMSDYGR